MQRRTVWLVSCILRFSVFCAAAEGQGDFIPSPPAPFPPRSPPRPPAPDASNCSFSLAWDAVDLSARNFSFVNEALALLMSYNGSAPPSSWFWTLTVAATVVLGVLDTSTLPRSACDVAMQTTVESLAPLPYVFTATNLSCVVVGTPPPLPPPLPLPPSLGGTSPPPPPPSPPPPPPSALFPECPASWWSSYSSSSLAVALSVGTLQLLPSLQPASSSAARLPLHLETAAAAAAPLWQRFRLCVAAPLAVPGSSALVTVQVSTAAAAEAAPKDSQGANRTTDGCIAVASRVVLSLTAAAVANASGDASSSSSSSSSMLHDLVSRLKPSETDIIIKAAQKIADKVIQQQQTAATQQSSSSSSSSSSGSSAGGGAAAGVVVGVIAGAVAGGVAFVVLALALSAVAVRHVRFWRRNAEDEAEQQQQQQQPDGPPRQPPGNGAGGPSAQVAAASSGGGGQGLHTQEPQEVEAQVLRNTTPPGTSKPRRQQQQQQLWAFPPPPPPMPMPMPATGIFSRPGVMPRPPWMVNNPYPPYGLMPPQASPFIGTGPCAAGLPNQPEASSPPPPLLLARAAQPSSPPPPLPLSGMLLTEAEAEAAEAARQALAHGRLSQLHGGGGGGGGGGGSLAGETALWPVAAAGLAGDGPSVPPPPRPGAASAGARNASRWPVLTQQAAEQQQQNAPPPPPLLPPELPQPTAARWPGLTRQAQQRQQQQQDSWQRAFNDGAGVVASRRAFAGGAYGGVP